MPHLTTPGGFPSVAAAEDGRPGLGVPGWAHPVLAPLEWAELARPGLPLHWAVLDVSSGPGSRPDAYCLAAAARLHASGTGLLGCLDMWDGDRSFGELVSDAHRYLDWYGVDGFYLAHCPAGAEHLPETRRTATTLRALCDGGHVVAGHGVHPHPGYADVADQLVTFRGGWTAYRWSQAAPWTADHPPGRFCHLVHGVPRTHLDEALRVARWQGAGTVYFTDRTDRSGRNPWGALPGYWDEIVSRIGPGVSE
ncbi:spherulation-specific family 4 protein [Streptomyces sp. HNM0574]|uniref:spherulation-specific family 4 protein n=1 Tax=Streptomyces sp. HNM0574 TaxID=2714954 RepID=UPI00146F47FE|nr:spherulation-specific family 4 protein [Streptomyces sp. HNM0574]NLU67276.1 phage tail protein [Streptomyces sp. HNM0574]